MIALGRATADRYRPSRARGDDRRTERLSAIRLAGEAAILTARALSLPVCTRPWWPTGWATARRRDAPPPGELIAELAGAGAPLALIDDPELSLRLGGVSLGAQPWRGPLSVAESADGETFATLHSAAIAGLGGARPTISTPRGSGRLGARSVDTCPGLDRACPPRRGLHRPRDRSRRRSPSAWAHALPRPSPPPVHRRGLCARRAGRAAGGSGGLRHPRRRWLRRRGGGRRRAPPVRFGSDRGRGVPVRRRDRGRRPPRHDRRPGARGRRTVAAQGRGRPDDRRHR